MAQILDAVLAVISILIVISVLLQNRGGELGSAFGGGGGFYRSKRGLEKILFNATIVMAALFIILSIIITSLV